MTTLGSLEELQETVVELWGDDRMSLEHAVSVLAVITGDVARHVRDRAEGATAYRDDLPREFGNYILTVLRMCHIFDISIRDAVTTALNAQSNYLRRRS